METMERENIRNTIKRAIDVRRMLLDAIELNVVQNVMFEMNGTFISFYGTIETRPDFRKQINEHINGTIEGTTP